ncbi:DNA-protecting protein DprA [Pantoea sp. Mb-10]|uniref:DNA-protecting protein DprA n=1 Tax=unclassified Pantoea TaxID=2630326 RepID=UPI001E2CD4FA|nr:MULTISPECIES: DNA-protecting protein DprA [unclassified Pantoea]MCE0492330.1 DNA-protecting protein DprA [Pantoea sp. Mb-10]MCE0503672.1 DNA-protecting protein DprA [Pantoea sp. Pb-8]
MDNIERILRLANVRGLSPQCRLQLAQALQDEAENADILLEACELNAQQRQQFHSLCPYQLERTRKWLEDPQHSLLSFHDARYPTLLNEIARRPPLLYVKGNVEALNTPQLAIVGSRQCSHYGREWGSWFTQQLALSGLTITSGLARGIDGVAHRAALDVNGKTVAVLGSGLQYIYPKTHRRLAEEIVSQAGALVSEFPLETVPHAANFPRRNRIISGLSLGVLVVEATLKSGSLVTGRYALEQNRNIYALPGALGNEYSEGTHWLIQQGALLVAHPNTILEDLHSSLRWLPSASPETIYSSDSDVVPLPFASVLANVGDEVTPVDVVAERAGQPVPAISAQLLELELAGWIAAVPGGYVRLRRASHVRRTNVLV